MPEMFGLAARLNVGGWFTGLTVILTVVTAEFVKPSLAV